MAKSCFVVRAGMADPVDLGHPRRHPDPKSANL
jgi:hypothetical protein